MGSRQFTINQGPRSFNKAAYEWKGKLNFNWAHAQTFTSPQNGSFSTYSSNYQTKLEKELIDFDSHQEKRLSSLRTQLGQQQDNMISKINLLWKTVSERLDDTPVYNTVGSPTVQMYFTSTNYPIKEELQDEAKEVGNVKSSTTEYKDYEMTVESEEEFEEEIKEEIKEKEEYSPKHFDTFPTMKELRIHYNWIMSKRLEPRRKPSNPKKICNFIGRVKRLKVFVGNFSYKCDFMMLEKTTSVIDHDLGLVVFRKPFLEAIGLVYDKKEGTIMFEKDKEKIVFKVPHKIEMFKHIDFTDVKTDRIPPFVVESDDDNSEKTHYSDSLDLGPEYKHDENVCRAIRSLIAMKAKRNKGEVISLEVLRKFHWTILGGRFNQLSHVSSPLLSKPGEY
nr:protein kinase-like domain, concanavalin A-like lectin/glucanase domain protein [Tanacetum cinerariifolium]